MSETIFLIISKCGKITYCSQLSEKSFLTLKGHLSQAGTVITWLLVEIWNPLPGRAGGFTVLPCEKSVLSPGMVRDFASAKGSGI